MDTYAQQVITVLRVLMKRDLALWEPLTSIKERAILQNVFLASMATSMI
jgi:hypothetical protein